MLNKSDFIAELKFKTTENGGRKTPAQSSYRPHIEFENYPEYLTSGQQIYIEKKTVNPGETVTAQISIYSAEHFKTRLFEGMNFKFCEGKKIIGTGKIIKIINSDLRIIENDKSSNNLNLYPKDIIQEIKTIYAGFDNEFKIITEFQKLLNSEKTYRSPRLIRAMIYLFTREKLEREKVFELVKTDWRDILFLAEYDKNENKIRDFNNNFGNENIKIVNR